jgi:hypothetical protein
MKQEENKQLLSVDSTYLDLDWQKLFGKDELIKALERLKSECNNPSMNAGYKAAIMDAIGLVEKLTIPIESQQREPLLAYHRYLTKELSLDLNELWVDEHLKANNCG